MFMDNQNPINCELVIKRLKIVILWDSDGGEGGGAGGGDEEEGRRREKERKKNEMKT
jgi:hypothetical protein